MGGKKSKIEMALRREETAAFFRRLADGIEAGRMDVSGVALEFGNFSSIKLAAKGVGESVFVSLSVKREAVGPVCVCDENVCACGAAEALAEQMGAEPGAGGKPKYKGLKKRLEKTWKTVREGLALGVLPEKILMDLLGGDFRAMLTYPGKGDEHYEENRKALEELQEAVAQGDLERARAVAALVERLKKECHRRYK